MAATKFSFDRVKKNIAQIKRDLPRLWASDAQNYYVKSFALEAFDHMKWKEVKRRMGPGQPGGGTKGTTEWRYPLYKGLSRRTNKILIGTGRLRQAVANTAAQSHVQYMAFDFKLTLRLDSSVVPYAGYLNDGTDKMVARKFFGDASELRNICRERLKRFMQSVW